MTEHYWKELCNDCQEGNEVIEQDVLAVRWAEARIKELERQLAESEKLKQGYHDEAAEGWKKYRELMSVTHEPTEAAIQDIAFCLQSRGLTLSRELAREIWYAAHGVEKTALEAGNE